MFRFNSSDRLRGQHILTLLAQKAAELILDTGPIAGPSMTARSPSPRRQMEVFELDDSRQGDVQPSRSHRRRVSLAVLSSNYNSHIPNRLMHSCAIFHL